MKHHPVVIALLVASPLSAQTSVETGGGVARLDHYSGGAFSSFRGQINRAVGPVRLSINNMTVEHRGLGTFTRTVLGVKSMTRLGEWEITAGPEARIARGVETSGARTFGLDLGVRRPVGSFDLSGARSQGWVWSESDRNSWHRTDLAATTRLGMFRVGSTFRDVSLSERRPRTDVVFLGTPTTDTMFQMQQRSIRTVGLNLGWQAGRVSFDGKLGAQFANQTTRAVWESNLAVRLGTSLSLVVGSSGVATDPLLKLRGGRFTSLGVRIGLPNNESRARPDALAFEVRSSEPGTYQLRFSIPGARRSATIVGDITGWKPVELVRRDDGRWELELPIKPGTYRINVAADGGAWNVPPGLAVVPDEFGGQVGLLVVR